MFLLNEDKVTLMHRSGDLRQSGDDENSMLDVEKTVKSWGKNQDADDQSTDDNTSNTASSSSIPTPISMAVANFFKQQSDTSRPSGGGGNWDFNGDGILEKGEADDHYMNGHGKSIVVDGNKIDLSGLETKDMTYDPQKQIYSLSTTKAFEVLPWKTAATYGGSRFKLVNGKWQMLSQEYHYRMRSWNSLENDVQNILTILGDPSNTLRPSEMNKFNGNVAPIGNSYYINITY